MDHPILCLNAGSSSLKFAVYQLENHSERALMTGEFANVGQADASLRVRGENGKVVRDSPGKFPSHVRAMEVMFAVLKEHRLEKFCGAGHRIVHGGPALYDPQIIDETVLGSLRKAVPFAPLHLPSQIAMVENIARHSPNLTQVACFDTAFHKSIPEVARRFALPRFLWDEGILRYGFHGLSYEYVVNSMGEKLGTRAIIAHLGNGASMVALADGKAIDTTMGLTPTGGFMMGTRSGDLDPGILLYLLERGWKREQISTMIEHQSGLTGVSGLTGDMKILLEKRENNAPSAQAVEMFCYQARKFVGALAAALQGLDALVFTGGIGEHAAPVRSGICGGLEFLGMRLDEALNSANATVVSGAGSRCMVYVVPTNEDLMVARHAIEVLSKART